MQINSSRYIKKCPQFKKKSWYKSPIKTNDEHLDATEHYHEEADGSLKQINDELLSDFSITASPQAI